MPVPFLDLRLQYESIKNEVNPAVQKVIDASAFALGPAVTSFEEAFAGYCGAQHCIGLNSGTAALTLLLRAYGIGPGDEVITAANTFFATVEAILHVGATPVLVDCEEATALIDPAKLERAITNKTKAIIPVHLYGQCADMDAINAIARKHTLIVIEDACQAHGALYKGKRAGSLGEAAAFSFYPGKNLGAYGEAGAVVTSDARITASIRMLRDHGQREKYHHDTLGWNERMDGLQGAVLGVKLKQLDAWNAKRMGHAEKYRSQLQGVGDVRFVRHAACPPKLASTEFSTGFERRWEPAEASKHEACGDVRFFDEKADREHVYHLFVLRASKRDALQQYLKNKNIDTGIHYPIPIHLLKAMQSYGWKEGDFPVAETLAKEILSLPMYPELTEEQIEEVCESIRSFFRA